MFRAQGREPLFMETATELRKNRHTFIECIPLSEEVFDTAEGYFRKSILEADAEWSQNKRLVETKDRQRLRAVVPQGFPYFHVEFGVGNGLLHVIEDEHLFPRSFGKEVVAGMLELDATVLRGTRQRTAPGDVKMQVRAFREKWKPYDWTAILDGACVLLC